MEIRSVLIEGTTLVTMNDKEVKCKTSEAYGDDGGTC
jgi:hypothetical protein